MSQSNGPDFNLPDEILAVIPTDPYDQLDLARKITSMAIASRVSNLEADMVRMKQKLHEKELTIFNLQEKLTHLEHANQEAESRLKIALDDNVSGCCVRNSECLEAFFFSFYWHLDTKILGQPCWIYGDYFRRSIC